MNRPYPLPPSEWICNVGLVGGPAVPKVVDMVHQLGTTDIVPSSGERGQLDDATVQRTFLVLLAYLWARWDTVRSPLLALECLIADFGNSDSVWLGDGHLAPAAAGIGETDEFIEHAPVQASFLSRKYKDMIEDHLKLGIEAGLILSGNSLISRA